MMWYKTGLLKIRVEPQRTQRKRREGSKKS
jgi:hypothetical protein